MKKFFSIVLLCLAHNVMFAQMGLGKPEDIKEVAAKPLLVVLDVENPKTIKKLEKKPLELQQYREDVAAYNSGVKAAFKNTWTFSKEVKYVTQDGLDSIMDDKSKKKLYAFFSPTIHRSYSSASAGEAAIPNTYSLDIGLTDQKMPVYSIMFSSVKPTEGDLTFVIQQCEAYFKQRLEKKDQKTKEVVAEILAKSPMLKEKTLLIDKDAVNKNLVKDIAQVYKYKYELCSKEKIDNAITAKDANYVYIKNLPVLQVADRNLTNRKDYAPTVAQMHYMQFVVYALDGSRVSMIDGMNSDGKTSKKDIQNLSEHIEGK
ncbi:MAG: hypothetical protein V4581_05680 [Bacteroidota bacterium]